MVKPTLQPNLNSSDSWGVLGRLWVINGLKLVGWGRVVVFLMPSIALALVVIMVCQLLCFFLYNNNK